MDEKYLFQSERLGFRNWIDADIPKMSAINEDEAVMEFFPSTATPEQTAGFVARSQKMFEEKGYCYFAVERLEDAAFIGFIGLFYQEYEAPFTPCVDIGWRLAKAYWMNGYATEGAQRCLEYAFTILNLPHVVATAAQINIKSIAVMKKIGMTHYMDFIHPRLAGNTRLEQCVCYKIEKS